MHRLPSSHSLRCFRIAALLFLATFLLIGASLVTLGLAIFHVNWEYVNLGIGLAVAAPLSLIMRAFFAGQTRCPLCMTPVLSKRSCAKHRRARKWLGSYRLVVALTILFRQWFRCPYCNESTLMKVRAKHADYYLRRR
jgi:hypothetical protein